MPLTVSVTCPDLTTARALARAALEARLAACANILPGVESHFWWDGALEQDTEVLLSFKTATAHRDALVDVINAAHPYDLAAITWSDDGAPEAVHDWIAQETASGG
ncbi:divalent-cation tolerance protein CutA [Tropicimonas sp. S265A]|uniref:divalent-cation tolerance protein CutA n=1 Tax=Tropicimonas sp. S265A TaxID=3415134 RepID=UPI003C7B85BE